MIMEPMMMGYQISMEIKNGSEDHSWTINDETFYYMPSTH